jgi:cobalamin biosynthesis protein CobT
LADIEAWLRDPGDLLAQLDNARERETAQSIAATDAATMQAALDALDQQKARLIRSLRMGAVSSEDIGAELDQIKSEAAALRARLAASEAAVVEVVPQEVHDTLAEIRARLDVGLTDSQRQEIVRLLANVVINTTIGEDGGKTAKAVVTYRFPAAAEGVVNTFTGTGSSPR